MSNSSQASVSRNMGQKIQILRREEGLSQAELACRLEVSRQAISKVERGAGRITVDRLFRIFDVLGYEAEITVSRRSTTLRAGWGPIRAEDPGKRRTIRRARKLAELLADQLYKEFAVETVYIFGSLVEAGGEMFGTASDIDLLVEGLPAEELFSARTSLEMEVYEPYQEETDETVSFSFDLVRAEDFSQSEQILNQSDSALLIPSESPVNSGAG